MRDDLEDLKHNQATLRLYTQRMSLQRRGNEFLGSCPFHSEKTPSFTVYQHDGVWLFKCQGGCKRAGNVIQFVENMDKIPFKDAVRKVKDFLGASWEGQKEQVEQTFRPIADEAAKEFKTYSLSEYSAFERNLTNHAEAHEWLLRERGITLETAQRLHLGYRQSLKSKDPTLQDVIDKGWIVLPAIDGDKVVSIKYRSIARKAFSRQFGMATALFNTESIDPIDALYVTEGEFDAAVLEQAGLRAISIPSASAPITPAMKDQMMQADRIILAGDNDNGVGAQLMEKLWAELGDHRTYLLKWPQGVKDANELWKKCAFEPSTFRTLVEDLTNQALSVPMPGVYSLTDVLMTSGRTNLADHPNRLRFPSWAAVDRMMILLPGSVLSLFATNTKMGKTCFVVDFTIDDALQHNEVILNYQCELSTDELANLAAAYVLQRDRNHLTEADNREAAKFLARKNVRYYVGRNPTLNTVTPVLDLIEAGIKRLGATIVVLDHIHFICRNESDEVQAQANAMQRIKNMAVKYKVKFVVVGQPRKANQQNRGKVVHISDAKGSETYTSDADAVIALHRDYVKIKDPEHPPQDDYDPKTEVHLLGARSKGDGPTFAVLHFDGSMATFREPMTAPPPDSLQAVDAFFSS